MNDEAALYTKMFIQLAGIAPSNLNLTWLFTTATNRTQKGVEVVGIYYKDDLHGSLGVFDWSCSPEYPCSNDVTGPAWIWVRKFDEFPCNVQDYVDLAGNAQNVIEYSNRSTKVLYSSPGQWTNRVYLWNYCTDAWDLVYDHEYRVDQEDCSMTGGCGWWGPILETFLSEGETVFPEINSLGFEDSALVHDGVWSELNPSETTFVEPEAPWILSHLDPNRSFGIGNVFVEALAVRSFTLVDATANEPVVGFDPILEGATINIQQVGRSLNVRANVTSRVESVEFGLNGNPRFRVENWPPYALFGDSGNSYFEGELANGPHTVTATPYSGDRASGEVGESLELNFTVVDDPVDLGVSQFVLVDADRDTDLFVLEQGDVLDRSALPERLNIRADVVGEVESVRFWLEPDGRVQTENVVPYALYGDTGGDYFPGTLSVGAHTLRAVPFEGNYGSGDMGMPLSIDFEVVND
ncbi:MAG: hypothetical protein ACFB9M_20160 [Myxococcota bacterium]